MKGLEAIAKIQKILPQTDILIVADRQEEAKMIQRPECQVRMDTC